MFLSDISIKRPIMISMILIVFVLFGAMAFFGLNMELTPPINFPVITIQTIYAGAGPQETELQISKKVEDAVASIAGIDYIQSYSMENISIVMVFFELDKDVYLALQEVKDKVDGISNELPSDADLPIMQRFDPNNSPVVNLVLAGPLPSTELYKLADKEFAPLLAQIPGVAEVTLVGGQEREIQVNFDNRVVLQRNISLPQIAQILASQNIDMPGGNFQRDTQEYSVRLKGEFSTIQTIRDLEIPTAHGIKKLGDIANVTDTGEDIRERIIYYDHDQKQREDNVIQLSLMKTSDGNPVEIYKRLDESLADLKKELPEGCQLHIVQENASFVKSSVNDTMTNILLGIILTSLVILFFLHDYKSTIIIVISMPFSIIATFLFMKMSGYTLNILSLMGLSTAVGILTANSVVVLENIFRHKAMGHDNVTSASKGTSEVVVTVVASTLTNLAVFLPLATMSSIAGRMFEQFSMTVVYATIFSLISAFTLTPMMASRLLPSKNRKKHPLGERLERMFRSWEKAYQNILKHLLTNKKRGAAVLVTSVILFVLSLFIASGIGFDFMPPMDEGYILVKVEQPVGYNLESTAKKLYEIEKKVEKYDDVSHYWIELGRLGETDIGVNLATMHIILKDSDVRNLTTAELSNQLVADCADISNVRIAVSQSGSFASGRADIQFYLTGHDAQKLHMYSNDLMANIKEIPGVRNLSTSIKSGKPEITIRPRRDIMARRGLTIYDLAFSLRSSMAGLVTTAYKEDGEEYDIRIRMNDESVDTPSKISRIPVIGPKGTYRMDQLADIDMTEGYSKILHYDRVRAISFECDVAEGFSMGDIMQGIDRDAQKLDMPHGYDIIYGAMAAEMGKTTKDILQAFIIAIILTYMLLAAILESLTQPLMILATVPLALIGVFSGLALTGLSMNIVSMLAIVMLIGIVVNNAILLLDYTNKLVREKGIPVHDALITACPTKLKAILMSNIAIILGMLPMAMGIGASGVEMRQPMGVVSIGGLLVSTVLSLIVIPVLYNVVHRQQEKRKKKEK